MITESEKISKWLIENKIAYINDFNISIRSWLKAGGIIRTYITPKDEQETIKVVNFLNSEKYDYKILGNLSNIIIRDGVIFTPILNLSKLNQINQKLYTDKLELTIKDNGLSLKNLNLNKKPDIKINNMEGSGLGVFLINTLMDQVEYESKTIGTKLKLVKYNT